MLILANGHHGVLQSFVKHLSVAVICLQSCPLARAISLLKKIYTGAWFVYHKQSNEFYYIQWWNLFFEFLSYRERSSHFTLFSLFFPSWISFEWRKPIKPNLYLYWFQLLKQVMWAWVCIYLPLKKYGNTHINNEY